VRTLNPSDVRRLLVVKLSSLGDVVHVTPCLKAIRRHFPHAEVVMAVEARFADVVRHNPHVDRLMEAAPGTNRAIPLLFRFAELRLRFLGSRIDVAVDFQGNRKSAVWVYASGAKVKAGRGQIRPGWDIAVQPDLDKHAIHVLVEIAAALGIAVDDPNPEIFLSPADDETLAGILEGSGAPAKGFVVINPFTAWASKCWPLDRYARLMEQIHRELHVPMVVTGGPGEEVRAGELMGKLAPGTASNLVGRLTLGQALCLYRRARLMLSGDSGPMHAAAALGTRVVALFGPTLPQRTGPWGDGHIVLQKSRPESHHAYVTDSYGAHIRAIDAESVWTAVASALQSRRDESETFGPSVPSLES
jgi:ADP-heptose:LPS heptosyltransferase